MVLVTELAPHFLDVSRFHIVSVTCSMCLWLLWGSTFLVFLAVWSLADAPSLCPPDCGPQLLPCSALLSTPWTGHLPVAGELPHRA